LKKDTHMKLDKLALAFSLGLICGLYLLIATLMLVFSEGEGTQLILLKRFYPGYSITTRGALIGFLWAFIDGFIAGWLIALLYNLFSKKS
jgi:hypothetical protein